MDHYFRHRDPAIFNKISVATVRKVLCQSIDEFKGEIEAWSQRGSGWVVEAVLAAYVNVTWYQPFRGGSYIILPERLKNKTKQNKNFTGIDFPTPVSQTNKLEKQNPDLSINVYGWEKDSMIVQKLSKKGGSVPRITFMLRENKGKWHYRYVKCFSALMYCQNNDKTKSISANIVCTVTQLYLCWKGTNQNAWGSWKTATQGGWKQSEVQEPPQADESAMRESSFLTGWTSWEVRATTSTTCTWTRPLSAFDMKRWIEDNGVHTLAYGHKKIRVVWKRRKGCQCGCVSHLHSEWIAFWIGVGEQSTRGAAHLLESQHLLDKERTKQGPKHPTLRSWISQGR